MQQPIYPHSEENTQTLRNFSNLIEGVDLILKLNARRRTGYRVAMNEIDIVLGDLIEERGFDDPEFRQRAMDTYYHYLYRLDR